MLAPGFIGYKNRMVRFREYCRVVGVAQVLYLLGRGLKRRGIRYTMLAIVICGSVMLVKLAGSPFFSKHLPQADLKMAAIPALVALSTLGFGNFLECVSNMFSSERILLADANSMNLMEDRKKADMNEHLEVLWERVFKYEAQLQNPGLDSEEAERIACNRAKLRELLARLDPQCRKHFGITDENVDEFVGYVASFRPVSQKLPVTKEGFIATAGFAMPRPLPQRLQEALCGCDLSLLEDWYDGAFFTANDSKLHEQFAANKTLRDIRQSVGINWKTKFLETLFGHPAPLWHILTMKKIGTSVGSLMAKMNKKYFRPNEPVFFDAQHFLWNDEENDRLIAQIFGERGNDIRNDVQQSRCTLFRNIFSSEQETARLHIYRMFGRDFVNAMDLRLDYDIEFAAGLLDHTPTGDIRDLSEIMLCPVYPEAKACLKVERAQRIFETIDRFLERNLPEVLDKPLDLRAARLGAMINDHNVFPIMAADPAAATSIFRENIIVSERRYTKRICLLRQHYELARLQLISYARMVDELAEFNGDDELRHSIKT
ncbi:MAG: hypothetical protein A2Z25_19545 [Planctomycetes bacterium RBG_16_55_9]|nr:MAG: hypothetical protein A2Z25_19545 [Planctomycetes bacterium RBG_16_55_9]